jgi:hypothetical protein
MTIAMRYRLQTSLWRTAASVAAVSCVVVIGVTGCAPSQEDGLGVTVDVGISPTPPLVGPTRLLISLSDSAGVGVEGAEVQVEGNMTHAGMAPVFATAQDEGEGMYVIPGFRFTMAGDWILTLRVTLVDGREGTYEHRTDVVSMTARDDTLPGDS